MANEWTDDAAPATSYACPEPGCGAVFVVDPAEPFEAHGQYLEHLGQHDEGANVPDDGNEVSD